MYACTHVCIFLIRQETLEGGGLLYIFSLWLTYVLVSPNTWLALNQYTINRIIFSGVGCVPWCLAEGNRRTLCRVFYQRCSGILGQRPCNSHLRRREWYIIFSMVRPLILCTKQAFPELSRELPSIWNITHFKAKFKGMVIFFKVYIICTNLALLHTSHH